MLKEYCAAKVRLVKSKDNVLLFEMGTHKTILRKGSG